MPHLVILYTPNIEHEADVSQLCRALADAMQSVLDEAGKPVFPAGGTRVLAYPAAHFAVADGSREFAFVYLNLRMGRGRSSQTIKHAGEVLTAKVHAFFEPLFQRRGLEGRNMGITFQVDEGHESFDVKRSNIHPLFAQ
jgi:5-carboxymethyl-2-hydroxymuconate isomerase